MNVFQFVMFYIGCIVAGCSVFGGAALVLIGIQDRHDRRRQARAAATRLDDHQRAHGLLRSADEHLCMCGHFFGAHDWAGISARERCNVGGCGCSTYRARQLTGGQA